MGAHKNIDYDKFPKQGRKLNKKTRVCFYYDTQRLLDGVVVRDDIEEPFLTIIKLEDGRHVLATECQYSISE